MFALSIRQPWAWLIVNGYKDIENRSWPTKYRGPVLIHAGKSYDSGFNPFGLPSSALLAPNSRMTEKGGIVGIVEIVDCTTDSESPWFFGEYGFVLRNARPLPFFPCRGQLGFFDVKLPQPPEGKQ